MRELSHLKKVGLNEVSNKTHITNETLEAIIEKDFASLHPTRAIGFINILQRDYQIDFTAWKEEFEQYRKENTKDDHGLFVYAKESNNSKSFSFGFFIVTIFIIVAIVFIFYSNSTPSNDDTTLSLVSKPIEEAKESLENKNIDFTNNSQIVTKDANDTIEEQNISSNEQNETVVNVQEPTSEQNSHEIVDEKKNEITQTDLQVTNTNENINIKSNGKIWIGLIDLGDYKKSQIISDDIAEINGSKSWLILTGHGMLEIGYKGQNLTYNSQYSQRFLFENGKIEEISKEKFNEINKGTSW